MKEILLYPRILFVSNRQTSTSKEINALLAKNLIPASSLLPAIALDRISNEELIQIIESADIDAADYDQTHSEMSVLKNLKDYEWVILDRSGERLFAAPIKLYVYLQLTSSSVHHYIKYTDPAVVIPYSDIDSVMMHWISQADNLSELPLGAAELINAHRPGSLRRSRIGPSETTDLQPRQSKKPRPKKPMFISVKQPEVVFKNYYESVILLQEYVQSNISELTEQFTNDGDLVFLGKWHNGSGAKATAFRLSDGRGQGGWLLHVELI